MGATQISALVGHIQDIVQPTSGIPVSADQPADHPRYKVPWWVLERAGEIVEISVDDEFVLEEDIGAESLGDLEKEVIEELCPDAFAYYVPFHFSRDRWGIYVRASGIVAITAHVLNQKHLPTSQYALLNSTWQMLLHHECFHYWTELACSRYEIPAIDIAGPACVPYSAYFWDASSCDHEEAMANANALRQVQVYHKRSAYPVSVAAGAESLLSSFMESQPPGYRDFSRHVGNADYARGQDTIIDHIRRNTHSAAGTPTPPSAVPGRRYFMDSRVSPCPIYLVKDRFARILGAARPFPAYNGIRIIVHTQEHDPPHFHLQEPIGVQIGRYEWPSLKPLVGAPRLSNSQQKKLGLYLQVHGKAVGKKIQSVFGPT